MNTRALQLLTLAAVLLSGCGKSTEQICRETDELLRANGKTGFTDTGFAACLELSEREAEQSLSALKDQLGKNQAKALSRNEFEQIAQKSTFKELVGRFGQPSVSSVIVLSVNGKPQSLVFSKYAVTEAGKDPAVYERSVKYLDEKLDGVYFFEWDRVTTHFGLTDNRARVNYTVKGGQISISEIKYMND